jgi:hypothetical protein
MKERKDEVKATKYKDKEGYPRFIHSTSFVMMSRIQPALPLGLGSRSPDHRRS